MSGPTRQDDIALLKMLYHMDHCGMTSGEIADAMGRSRSAVMGAIHRVRVEMAAFECCCVHPENQDGGMPARWWAK